MLFLLNLEAKWEDPADDDANVCWEREGVSGLAEYSDGSSYVNFAGFNEEGDEIVRSTYGTHHQRLAELKTKYDPENIFRLNSNIKPANVI